jgi:hypothetical protein
MEGLADGEGLAEGDALAEGEGLSEGEGLGTPADPCGCSTFPVDGAHADKKSPRRPG